MSLAPKKCVAGVTRWVLRLTVAEKRIRRGHHTHAFLPPRRPTECPADREVCRKTAATVAEINLDPTALTFNNFWPSLFPRGTHLVTAPVLSLASPEEERAGTMSRFTLSRLTGLVPLECQKAMQKKREHCPAAGLAHSGFRRTCAGPDRNLRHELVIKANGEPLREPPARSWDSIKILLLLLKTPLRILE